MVAIASDVIDDVVYQSPISICRGLSSDLHVLVSRIFFYCRRNIDPVGQKMGPKQPRRDREAWPEKRNRRFRDSKMFWKDAVNIYILYRTAMWIV
jgi:hypothetical protein